MPSLPTGTVTFLFTDIEGSTQLLQRLGDRRTAEVFGDHRRLLRTAFEEGGGHEIETQGDGFLVAFQSARDAIFTCLTAQRAIAAHTWPDGAILRVRMGLDTAETTAGGDAHVGLGIHRAARICSAGWGGQILLSRTTATIIENDLPAGAGLRDLGRHRLKDLQRPERIYQLTHGDLPSDFPPLRSLDVLPNNLPRQLTSFIGRDREMAEVKRLLAATHLLTLTGSGGCGKTRLGLQVAVDLVETFPDGVWFVDLAPLSDPTLVPQEVASTLRVREEPGRPLIATLSEHLRPRHLLVVLDNCEHLIAACAGVAEALLRVCPHVRILATSREPLRIAGETAWRVPSLALPDPLVPPPIENLTQYAAVRLFIDRASAALPDFAVTDRTAGLVAQVCHRLDGIPLAIELAAARVKVLPVNQIAARLDDRFRLLTRGSRTALPRQQTLQATIEWSYDLLPEAERVLLRRLSVFSGGWTLEAAEAICAGQDLDRGEILELMTQLVDKSLVMADVREGAVGGARYWLLETVRQYGAETLRAAGEEWPLHRRHWEFFVDLVEGSSLRGTDQVFWVERFKAELDNLRTALNRSKADADGTDAALRLVASLWWFWFTQGMLGEGRAWLEAALVLPGTTPTPARASALYGTGAIAWSQGNLRRAAELAGEALNLCRTLDDRLGIVYSLSILGAVGMFQGDYERAARMFEEGLTLSRGLGYQWETATLLGLMGWSARYQGDFTQAAILCEESLGLFRSIGDHWGVATMLSHLGNALWRQGKAVRARELLEESVRLAREYGNRAQLATSLHELGRLELAQGALDRAVALEREALTIRKDQEEMWGVAECLEGFAALSAAQRQPERTARLLAAADALREAISIPLPAADRADRDRSLMTARAALGDDALAAGRDRGRAMTFAQAVEDALSE